MVLFYWINLTSIIFNQRSSDSQIKHNFFQAAAMSILLYGCTTWTLNKPIEKKLDGNCTRMLWAILNKSWKQYPTKQLPYGHLPSIPKTIQIRQTRHAGHYWRSKDKLIAMFSCRTLQTDVQVLDDQLELIYSSSVQTQDIV